MSTDRKDKGRVRVVHHLDKSSHHVIIAHGQNLTDIFVDALLHGAQWDVIYVCDDPDLTLFVKAVYHGKGLARLKLCHRA